MKKFSQARKAVLEKKLRKQRKKDRSFNDPLRIFIQRKYTEIFKEYQELYQAMVEENPDRRDYTTSKTFRKWMDSHPESDEIRNPPSIKPLLVPQIVLESVYFLPTTEENNQFGKPSMSQSNQHPMKKSQRHPSPTHSLR